MEYYKNIDFSELDLDVIVEYISKKSDAEVILLLAFIEENFKIISDKQSLERNFYILKQKFEQFKEIVEYQIRKEELILFPFLKQIARNDISPETKSNLTANFGNPIEIISRDHSKILNHLSVLKKYYSFLHECNNELLKFCANNLLELDSCVKENFSFRKTVLFPKIISLQNTQSNWIN